MEGPSWSTYAKQRLAGDGYRRGGGRNAVIELLESEQCALSAQEIEEALRTRDRKVGRATIYRALDELAGLGLIAKVEIGDGIARYESLFPDGAEHHHHLVCDHCGKLIPFVDDELEKAIRRIARREAFEVADHDVTLHGACAECSAQL